MTFDKEFLKDLRSSLASPTGQLVAVLRCKQDGRVLSGNHRVAAGANRFYDMDIDERAKVAGISHELMEELCIIEANVQRKVEESERAEDFARLAKLLKKEGIADAKIASRIIEITGFSDSYVYRNLPEGLKNPNRVEAMKQQAAKRLSELSSLSTPYAKGTSPQAGSQTQRAFTSPAMKMLMHLKAAGMNDVRGEIEFDRQKTNPRGQELTYHADICDDFKKLIVEVEGEGSGSKDNEDRKDFFIKKGYRYIEVSNALAESEYGAEVADIIAALA